ncbi:MAG: ATPase [Thermodesulfobacteriota bacterium]
MIVRMAKVEIAGPQALLTPVLSLVRDAGLVHLEPRQGRSSQEPDRLRRQLLPPEQLFEALFLEDLAGRIQALFALLPAVPVRQSLLSPQPILATLSRSVDRHLATAQELARRQEATAQESAELERHGQFLEAVADMLAGLPEAPDLEIMGLVLRDERAAAILRRELERLTGGAFTLAVRRAAGGILVGLLVLGKKTPFGLDRELTGQGVAPYALPPALQGLPLAAALPALRERLAALARTREGLDRQAVLLAQRWGPIYRQTASWIRSRLGLLAASAAVFSSQLCFFLYGWMPAGRLADLRALLEARFGGQILVSELAVADQDLDEVPVLLENPAYFRPFQLLTRLLPLPSYASFDPTPFVGLFFPLFFGMILGDVGYGVIFAGVAAGLVWRGRTGSLRDAGRILGVAAAYAILFGLAYGELLGDLGHRLFGLVPFLVERQTAILPMLLFAVAVGCMHILCGLALSAIAAVRRRTGRKAVADLVTIGLIAALAALILSGLGLYPQILARPALALALLLAPLLLWSGGLLAPLELLKTVGHIISYARIMAIGLTSALLATVANQMAGLTGDLVLGVVAASLLHLVNLFLGLFSPTIHSLRLHYVEFFDKFLHTGGRRYEPLQADHHPPGP